MTASKQIRPHQERAIELLRASLSGGAHMRPILQLPTGAGKTVVAANIIRMARAKGNRVVFCVPAISLIDQTVEAFYSEGIRDIGVIQGDHPMQDWSRPVQIASVQTLARRTFPDAGLVIVDEAHMRFKVISRWMQECERLPFIGLSATPWTAGLGKDWDDLLIAATTRELIDAGYLSDYVVYAPSSPDLSGVKIVAGDYQEDQLSAIMRDHKLVGDVVDSWIKLGNDDPTLVFAVDRAHARELQAQFLLCGVPMGYCDAYTKREERKVLFEDMKAGRIKGICNVGTLTTGVDADVRTLVLARPTKSHSLFVQIIGRALRTAPGKERAVIIDHSDTTLRLGLPCGIYSDKLCTGEKAESGKREYELKAAALPKQCPKCATVKEPGVRKCPTCGFEPVVREDVPTAAGELRLLSGKPKARVYTMTEKQAWLSGLIAIGLQKGRKPGWAANTYRDKFGVWPNGLEKSPGEVLPEVERFVKAKAIRYAKGRAKAQEREGMRA